jgi:hypothetical protein
LRGRRILYGPQIEVEQRLLFVALVRILFAQAKDFLQHFYVEALSLGLGEDFLLALISGLKFFVDVLDALDERENMISRNSNRVGHAVPLCDGSKGYGGEGCREVNAFVLIPSDFTYRASAVWRRGLSWGGKGKLDSQPVAQGRCHSNGSVSPVGQASKF